MSTESRSVEKIVANLKTERDELRLQMHLAKENFQDEWEEMEQKWEKLEHKLAAAKNEAVESSIEVGVAVKLLAEKIHSAYRRIRKSL